MVKCVFMINQQWVHWGTRELLREIYSQLFENKKIDECDEKSGTYQFEDFELQHIDFTFNKCLFVIKVVKEDKEKNKYDLFADISYNNYWDDECDGEMLDFFIEEIY